MKHLAKKRLLWASAAVGLLVLCKFVIYDTYIRCQQDFNSQEVRIETPTSTSAPPNENSIALIHRNYDFQLSIVSNLFEPTIRSCLGSKCFDMPAKTVDRVGLLAPQSSGAEVIYRIIKKANFNINSENFQFILDSHVPAYGYGKNHGWSRIIRIVRSPILQALQLLHTSQRFHSAEAPSLLESQVRQLVRWHCRLSHVAAHTRMLTVYIDDFFKRPVSLVEQILTFSGFPLPDRSVVKSLAEEMRHGLKEELLFENFTNFYSAFSHFFSSEPPAAEEINSLLNLSVDSLREEIIGTKDLSMWPCRSFRSISPPAILPLRLLVPNCSSPWVTCSVEYDRQENEGK